MIGPFFDSERLIVGDVLLLNRDDALIVDYRNGTIVGCTSLHGTKTTWSNPPSLTRYLQSRKAEYIGKTNLPHNASTEQAVLAIAGAVAVRRKRQLIAANGRQGSPQNLLPREEKALAQEAASDFASQADGSLDERPEGAEEGQPPANTDCEAAGVSS